MIYKNYEYFLAIANKGSLTKAAESLYITQPSLSKYLSRLETSLNMELFDRTTSPLTLTYAGKRYYEYVQDMLALDQRLSEEFNEIRNNVRGEITIGIASWRSAIIMPTLLPMFYQRYPHVQINVEEGRSYTFERAMLNGKVDFCMMTLPSSFNVATVCESMGMGNIAQRIAKILHGGFGVHALGYDPFVSAEEAAARGFEKVDTLEELLERSDMVNINVPLVKSTERMISGKLFDHFKPGAVFINAARGAVIDEEDLYNALASGKLKAAACDTFVQEPPTGENKLLSLDNFSATPHIGGNTEESLQKAGTEVVDETLNVLAGRTPIHPVL